MAQQDTIVEALKAREPEPQVAVPSPYVTERLLHRAAPFMLAVLLTYALMPMRAAQIHAPHVIWAAVGFVATFGIGWLQATAHGALRWLPRLLPFIFLLSVFELREGTGGAFFGYGALFALPAFWAALYDTRTQLLIVTLAMFFAQAGTGLFDGDPVAIRRAILNAAATGLIALAVQRSVAELRMARAQVEHEADERTRGSERLAESNTALARSNRELEQFAYVSSHDLQEPLRMIRSFSQLFVQRHGDTLNAEGTELLGYVVDGAERAQRLVNDLLDYSRVGSTSTQFEPVDLAESLDRALVYLGPAIEDSGATIERHGDLPIVDGDSSQLDRLFINLVGNALKYRHPDRAPRIQVTAERLDGDGEPGCRITIQDNGIGFDDAHAERIFLMFQRLHGRAEYEGTGIGLAICARIVERHGGTIRASERLGIGATFTFTLGGSG